jgi:plastocyanin domain-containing protein
VAPAQADGKNVFEENGKQIIEISARGGYAPRQSIAKSGIPTVIRMKTSGTFDCSSALSIPSLGIRLNLPSSGTKDIEIPAQQSGSTLAATCAMGMYNFQIQFN